MLEVFISLKRTLQCKPQRKQVHDPKTSKQQKGNQRTKSGPLEYSNSNIKGFIQGSKRYSEKSQSFHPKNKGSIDISDPIIHEILLDSSNSQNSPCPPRNSGSNSEGSHRTRREAPHVDYNYNETNIVSSNTRLFVQNKVSNSPSILICYKCGEKLKNIDVVEAHHISKHSVIELEEDSSRQIVETICGTSSISSELGQIDCILKVQNMPKTLACFEEYREMVKNKANELQNKHPRCLVDGNEVLRFHGTTIACSLGIHNCYSLCNLDYCGVCQILRHGFSNNKEFQGALRVHTSSTSVEAFDSIRSFDERGFLRKSVIVCRVIAGRVHCPSEEIQEKFDSLAEKFSNNHSEIEELYLLNPKALLPCFVVIYKQQIVRIKGFQSSLRISSI